MIIFCKVQVAESVRALNLCFRLHGGIHQCDTPSAERREGGRRERVREREGEREKKKKREKKEKKKKKKKSRSLVFLLSPETVKHHSAAAFTQVDDNSRLPHVKYRLVWQVVKVPVAHAHWRRRTQTDR